MEKITQVNATAANLFTNFTPTNTIVPAKWEKWNIINTFIDSCFAMSFYFLLIHQNYIE